ncbi:M20/M25/M40 family metallo-hydrolase [Cytobacillus oceanisediminis]|uniref:M20/M25/M40 family metallo-hydrolase n=1 Tax=Cytobacillus oceanisediminis TaxID=665099 RepID=UPI0023DB71FB|nr:M20/M25/M40 family metallo-hydrolase [Cytobacillus oceanisediminis]MDF2039811.1 M20/M25/M40 family metallo-hydrolase [Cytobacillus oceanisediminis]
MKHTVETIEKRVEKDLPDLISSLQDFLRIKSISAQNIGMEECASFLLAAMKSIGIECKMLEKEGAFPVIYGEVLNPTAKKTLLIYGHYDVQPPEPLHLWESDPFDPVIREDKIFARGATDDKGNLLATIMAVKCLKDADIPIPINLKFFFEGEEEIGSPNFKAYMEENKELLSADYTILCDRGVHESGRPQMYLGHKGITHAEITIKGAKRDVHSGQAPFIPNAAWQLVRLLNQLKDENENIMIPGYYDDVLPPSTEDLKMLENIPFDKKEYCEVYGIPDILPKSTGVEALTSLLFKPTATINGLSSGYQGEGNKTIVPNMATVKLDFRFVKNQDPQKCVELIRGYLENHCEGSIVIKMGDVRNPSKVSLNAEVVQVAIEASKMIYKEDPVVWPMLDGAGPMSLFEEILNAPAIIIGLGAPFAFANTHAPNENISIENYSNGIKLMASIYYLYGMRDEIEFNAS